MSSPAQSRWAHGSDHSGPPARATTVRSGHMLTDCPGHSFGVPHRCPLRGGNVGPSARVVQPSRLCSSMAYKHSGTTSGGWESEGWMAVTCGDHRNHGQATVSVFVAETLRHHPKIKARGRESFHEQLAFLCSCLPTPQQLPGPAAILTRGRPVRALLGVFV